jgi:hypothetical protein
MPRAPDGGLRYHALWYTLSSVTFVADVNMSEHVDEDAAENLETRDFKSVNMRV